MMNINLRQTYCISSYQAIYPPFLLRFENNNNNNNSNSNNNNNQIYIAPYGRN